MPWENMQENLQRFELEARKLLKKTGAAHVIYGRKMFSETGELTEIRFYLLPMEEDRFDEVSLIRRQQIYAVHRL